MKKYCVIALMLLSVLSQAQIQPDRIYSANIHSVKLYKAGNIYSYPVIALNSGETLELHFDDLESGVKTYYYSFELRNADWTPSVLRSFDYTKGFSDVRITNYRNSSIAFTRYTHYQAVIPDRNSAPSRSGNYLLRVFINGDTSRTVFTKRFLVVDNKATVTAQIQQPFNSNFYNTHQKVQVSVNTNGQINSFNATDVKVTVLQNYTWPSALHLQRPTILRGNYFEFNDEVNTVFEAGKEWRWIDLRSLRLLSDRMLRIDTKGPRTDVYVKPDGNRNQQAYVYYRDLNGFFTIETLESINPFWQSDYSYVHFSFYPPGNKAFEGRSVYLYGELTNYLPDDSSKMIFNEEKGAYEKILLLKQGFYNYSYITKADKDNIVTFENTEGNYWGTENAYTVLVYYRPFGARVDELIGYNTVNSVFQRGAGF
jgi:hypothetical protein